MLELTRALPPWLEVCMTSRLQQGIFLHRMPSASALETDIVGNFSGNNHSSDNHLKPLSYAIIARNAPLLSNQMIPNDSGILFELIKLSLHVSEFSTYVGNITAQNAAVLGATSEDPISPLC